MAGVARTLKAHVDLLRARQAVGRKTGGIWLAQLDPTVGSEIQKTRPCVVISPNEMNAHLRTAIVAPVTTASRPAHLRVAVTFQRKQGLIVLDQVEHSIERGWSSDWGRFDLPH